MRGPDRPPVTGCVTATAVTPPRRHRARRDESGVASVWALVLIGVLILVADGVCSVVGVVGAHHRAEGAADLAALAGAAAIQQGADGCAAAARVAGRNGAELMSCDTAGAVLQVRVEVRTRAVLGRVWALSGTAKAGPDSALG